MEVSASDVVMCCEVKYSFFYVITEGAARTKATIEPDVEFSGRFRVITIKNYAHFCVSNNMHV